MVRIDECVFCGCKDVPEKTLTLEIDDAGTLTLNVVGAQCSNCGEKYYPEQALLAVEVIQKTLTQQAVGA